MTNRDYALDSDRPEVIQAKAEARERVLKARAQLHPAAQVVYAVFDSIGGWLVRLGCLVLIGLLIMVLFAPSLLQSLFNR